MVPIGYDYKNALCSTISPSTLHVKNAALTQFFSRYLWQDLFSVIKWTLPDTWSESLFMWCVYVNGTCAIINTDKFGVIPQPCTLGGLTVQYQPAYVLVSNPMLNNGYKQLIIGEECGLLHPTLDYWGFGDLVGYYADMMSVTAESLGMNIWNSKLSYVFASPTKAMGTSFEKMFDKISAGNPAVVVDSEIMDKSSGKPTWFPFDANVGSNYVSDRIVVTLNNLIDMFHTDIGIPNANTDKKERLVEDEVNANNVETAVKIDSILDRLKKQVEDTRKLFRIPESEFNCEWRFEGYGTMDTANRDLQSQPRDIRRYAGS